MLRNINYMVLGLVLSVFYTFTAPAFASPAPNEAESCAVAMAQFRYYAHGYETGAKWIPGSLEAPKYAESEVNPEGVIIDYYIAKEYTEGSNQIPVEITRRLIHTAYNNYQSGHSASFGSYWTLASCMGVINKPIEFLGRCDEREAQPTKRGFQEFVQCAGPNS